MQKKIDARSVDLREEDYQVLQAAAWPINRPGHDHVEFALCGRFMQPVESRSLVSALSAANSVILVNIHDLPAGPFGDFPEFALLVGRGLVLRRTRK